MLRQVGHFARHLADLGDIVKDHHRAAHVAAAVMDGRDGIFNNRFQSVTTDQETTRRAGLRARFRGWPMPWDSQYADDLSRSF